MNRWKYILDVSVIKSINAIFLKNNQKSEYQENRGRYQWILEIMDGLLQFVQKINMHSKIYGLLQDFGQIVSQNESIKIYFCFSIKYIKTVF